MMLSYSEPNATLVIGNTAKHTNIKATTMYDFWRYDYSTNTACYAEDMIFMNSTQFFRSREYNFFHVRTMQGVTSVTSTSREEIVLRDVTEEQAVILMAALRRMKEAAME